MSLLCPCHLIQQYADMKYSTQISHRLYDVQSHSNSFQNTVQELIPVTFQLSTIQILLTCSTRKYILCDESQI
jgi:hypothetical protein